MKLLLTVLLISCGTEIPTSEDISPEITPDEKTEKAETVEAIPEATRQPKVTIETVEADNLPEIEEVEVITYPICSVSSVTGFKTQTCFNSPWGKIETGYVLVGNEYVLDNIIESEMVGGDFYPTRTASYVEADYITYQIYKAETVGNEIIHWRSMTIRDYKGELYGDPQYNATKTKAVYCDYFSNAPDYIQYLDNNDNVTYQSEIDNFPACPTL